MIHLWLIYSRSLCTASSLKAPVTIYLCPFHSVAHIIVIYYNGMSGGLRSEWACCIMSWGRYSNQLQHTSHFLAQRDVSTTEPNKCSSSWGHGLYSVANSCAHVNTVRCDLIKTRFNMQLHFCLFNGVSVLEEKSTLFHAPVNVFYLASVDQIHTAAILSCSRWERGGKG